MAYSMVSYLLGTFNGFPVRMKYIKAYSIQPVTHMYTLH